MSIIFEQIHTPGIAQLSYLLGDASAGKAAVIDPRPDTDLYLELAQRHGVAITDIFETHIHADFLSGAVGLQARLPAAAIHASKEGDKANYGFACNPLRNDDEFTFGELVLTAKHTPGHTPEHMSFLAAEAGRTASPWAVFSGDSLFVNSVGRPDLLGEGEDEELAGLLFETIFGFYASLDDGVTIFPGHGAGSSCGADIGDLKSSTLGYERRHNEYLQIKDRAAFIQRVLGSAPPEPCYYKPMKVRNAEGSVMLGGAPAVAPLPVHDFQRAAEATRSVLVDTREMLAFGGGHIPGALNLGASSELSPWAGWMLKFDDPILLVLADDRDLDTVVPLLWRTGYVNFAGYLAGGMKAWSNAGLPIANIPQMSVHALRDAAGVQILDVRAPSEWEGGHVPGARHIFTPELRGRVGELDPGRPIAVYCNSGYRASIAASVLKQENFADVRNVPGSWQAWTSAGFPVEGGPE